ncbi:unknown [Proteobacteria bacterium CAG:495]|nr:unknown [Proteobacteria bacterium CAG:495]
MLRGLEQKYKMTVIISADDSIKCISDYRIERTKNVKPAEEEKNEPEIQQETAVEENANDNETRNEENEEASGEENNREGNYRGRRRRDNRRRGRNRFDRRNNNNGDSGEKNPPHEKQEAVILYNSHEDINSKSEPQNDGEPVKEKSTWWKKLIKG